MRNPLITFVLVLLCASSAYSLTGQQFMTKFISLYNEGSFEAIIKLYSTKYQIARVKTMVIKNLTETLETHGKIISNVSLVNTPSTIIYMVAFEKDLSVGALGVALANKKVQYGMVAPIANTSFLQDVEQNSESVGFKFIFDDATISKNSGSSFPVEALQIFPVSVEYCNQIAQGKLKSSRIVTAKEVKKYFINNYDGNFNNFDIARKTSQTLGSLVKQNILYPSLAVSEYLVDLLGLENIKDTMDSLGISQDRTMYPASYYVQMAQATASAKSTQEFMGTITDLSDSDITDANEQVHAILKTGNKTAIQMIKTTITQLAKSNTTMDGINIKNTFGTAADYADALESFITKDFSLDGNTNTIYTTMMGFKRISTKSSLLGQGSTHMMFRGQSLDGTVTYKYDALALFSIPKKASYKSLAFCMITSGVFGESDVYSQSFSFFLMNLLASAEFRMAAEDAF